MGEAYKVLVVLQLSEEKKQALAACNPNAHYTYAKASEVSQEVINDSDVIIGSVSPEQIKDSKKLKWLQLSSAGTDRFHEQGMPNNAILTNSTGAYGLALAEHMVGMLFMVAKKLHLYRDNQLDHQWVDEGAVQPIYGATSLIIGLGDIGCEFAKRMKAMNSRVIGVKRTMSQKPAYVDELYLSDEIDRLLPLADIVFLSVPATKDTMKLLNKERIALMKPNAIVLNVGRGSAIDTEALCDAVAVGRIFGAGLDVTDPEPLPKDHRMWDIKNILITPHISGGFSLEETYNRVVDIAIENYRRFSSGNELKNIVDFNAGY